MTGPRFLAACALAVAGLVTYGAVDFALRSRRWRNRRGLWLEA